MSSADESDEAPEFFFTVVNKVPHEPDLEWLDGDTMTFKGNKESDRSFLLAMKMQHLSSSEQGELKNVLQKADTNAWENSDLKLAEVLVCSSILQPKVK